MYCQECGARNDDRAKFCEECGAPLEQEVKKPVEQVALPAVKPGKRFNPVILAEILLLVGLSLLCWRQIKRLNDPEHLVKSYMDAILDQDWEKAYSYLELPEENAEYLTASAYAASSLSQELSDITNYTIEKDKKKWEDEVIVRNYAVNYRRRGSDSEMTMWVPVTKGRDKRWLVLDDWKITADKSVVRDTTVVVPPYAVVSMDGHVLNEPADHGTVLIPWLFRGEHVLEVSMEGTEPYSEVREVSYDEAYLELRPPYLTEDTLKAVAEKSLGYWNKLLDCAVNPEKAWPDIMSEDEIQTELDKYDVGGSDSYFTAMNLSDVTADVVAYEYDPEAGLLLDMNLKGTLTRNVQYGKKSWFLNQLTYEARKYEGEARLRLKYYFDGTEWRMVYLSTTV